MDNISPCEYESATDKVVRKYVDLPMTIVGLRGSVNTETEVGSGTVFIPPNLTLILIQLVSTVYSIE